MNIIMAMNNLIAVMNTVQPALITRFAYVMNLEWGGVVESNQ